MTAEDLVRAYRSADTRRQQLLTVVNGCFDGVWLGLLDRTALERLDELFYSDGQGRAGKIRRSRTHSEEYNLSGLQGWEEAALKSHFPADGRVAVTVRAAAAR